MSHTLAVSYDYRLVIFSVAIATLASYTALDLAGRVTAARGRAQIGWLAGGAAVMGIGIWSMHFIGMLAFKLPIPVDYRFLVVLGSVLPAVLACGLALFLVSRPTINVFRLLGGSVLMGTGIAAMHYVGMAAMQTPDAIVHYNLTIVGISVGIAFFVSLVALHLAFHLRDENTTLGRWKKAGSAIVMGSAVPSMHYVGMAAVSVTSTQQLANALPLSTDAPAPLAVVVGCSSLVIIGFTSLTSFFDRKLNAHVVCTEALQASQNYLQMILEGIQVGVLVVGGNCGIQLVNQAALNLLGFTNAQLHEYWSTYGIASTQIPHTPPESLLKPHLVLDAIAKKQIIKGDIIGLKHGVSQHQSWLLVTVIPQYNPVNETEYIICTFSNITDLKQAEEALRKSEIKNRAYIEQSRQLTQTLQGLHQAQARLVQQEKMSCLGQMLAGVAHEINNPVNFLYGNISHANQYIQDLVDVLNLYQEHYPSPKADIQTKIDDIDLSFVIEDISKLMSSMKMGADRILQIVLSLRNFSRLDDSEMKQFDLHEGLDDTLLLLQHRLKANSESPEISISKDYGDLPFVECYAGQMNQVFMNVLSNAIDALREHAVENPSIFIQTQLLPHSSINIQISDNGPGIPEAVRAQIFEPFFTTKPVGKGTGLGLPISYQVVVDKHGGSLKCISESGQGTTFKIEIPTQVQSK